MLQPFIAAGLLAVAQPTPAQLPDLGSFGGGALSGLGSGLFPDIGSVGASNAPGLLGYCIKRQLLGAANAGSVLGKLTGNPSVAASPEYAAGQSGQLLTGNRTISLAGSRTGSRAGCARSCWTMPGPSSPADDDTGTQAGVPSVDHRRPLPSPSFQAGPG